mgnify:CR=1 FL=1
MLPALSASEATAPKIDAVGAEIKRKAPKAKVFLVGYPTLVPQSGNGCYPLVPVLGKDVPYLRAKTVQLNAMIAARAAAAGAPLSYAYGSRRWDRQSTAAGDRPAGT